MVRQLGNRRDFDFRVGWDFLHTANEGGSEAAGHGGLESNAASRGHGGALNEHCFGGCALTIEVSRWCRACEMKQLDSS